MNKQILILTGLLLALCTQGAPAAQALPLLHPATPGEPAALALQQPTPNHIAPALIALDDGEPPEDVDECEGDECEGIGGSSAPPEIED
ncbi:MAG: hypothetical protein AB7P76_10410 [Candidatus Melainabacteria bacterium]